MIKQCTQLKAHLTTMWNICSSFVILPFWRPIPSPRVNNCGYFANYLLFVHVTVWTFYWPQHHVCCSSDKVALSGTDSWNTVYEMFHEAFHKTKAFCLFIIRFTKENNFYNWSIFMCQALCFLIDKHNHMCITIFNEG